MEKECEICLVSKSGSNIIYKELPCSIKGFLLRYNNFEYDIVINKNIESKEMGKICFKKLLNIENNGKCKNINVVNM